MDGQSTLYYALHPSDALRSRESLAAVTSLILSTVEQLLDKHGFVWHKDSFELRMAEGDTANDIFLEGRIRVGESIEDEWVAVWLLRELSKTYDFVVEVHDTDGQFLLIEAAHELPQWVTPARAQNRLWIKSGRLHLVPIDYKSPGAPRKRRVFDVDDAFDDLKVDDDNDAWIDHLKAIQVVRDERIDTLASPSLENAAFARINVYPAALASHQHTFVAYLPPPLAAVCAHTSTPSRHRHTATSLTQKAIEAFACRDAAGTRAAQKMSRFTPSDTTPISITVTRTAYAQMQGQRFYPPRAFHPDSWPSAGRERERRDKGMRVACGFEILYDESKHAVGRDGVRRDVVGADKDKDKDTTINTSIDDDAALKEYIDKLTTVGFFRGEVHGSVLYQELRDKATRTWLTMRENQDSDERFSFAVSVERLLSETGITNPLTTQDDDEKWMEIDAADFDDYLSKRMHDATAAGAPDATMQASADTLGQFGDKLNAFMEGEGGMNEARFGGEEFSDEGEGDDSSDEEEGEHALNDSDKQRLMDDLVPSLGQDEWGASTQSQTHQEKQQENAATTRLSAKHEAELMDKVKEYVEDPATKQQREEDARLRRPHFEKEEYDGYSSEEEEGDEETRDTERLKSGIKELGDDEMEDDVENLPQVVGDVDIDMANEEEDFLTFSREALGIDDALWNKIISERKERGAFVPTAGGGADQGAKKKAEKGADSDEDDLPAPAAATTSNTTSATASNTAHTSPPPKKAAKIEEVPDEEADAQHARPPRNDKLNSFEAVMEAMDSELAKGRGDGQSAAPPTEEQDEEEQLRAMDEELKSILARVDPNNETLDDSDADLDNDDGDLEQGDYSTMRNFLESFKAQSGLSGPVSNLAASFGERLPRDHQ